MTLGQTLRDIRDSKGISQTRLGKLANVPQTTISNIERDVVSPTIATLLALASALNITIDDLLNYQSDITDKEVKKNNAGI